MERREIAVRGIVQGVGFRPFIYGLARRLKLHGSVRNTPVGVVIEIEGDPSRLDAFQAELRRDSPPRASIDAIETVGVPVRGERGFRIIESQSAADYEHANIRLSPDVATCDACLADLFDPANRRYHYPFITCATCGPRLTVVTGAPYDRERTTMARFTMCHACRREYEDPLDRRFHAETIGCAACGPRLTLRSVAGAIEGDPISELASLLERGVIAAIKGLGGYHLACDAANPAAVAELRRRKHRDEKPFAVMFDSVDSAELICEVNEVERRTLLDPSRPIVLLSRRTSSDSPGTPHRLVAPGSSSIGAMLPSTPVQHMLMAAVRRPLVMTSGNRSQEPIAIEDDDALTRLTDIASVFLTNDRPIHVRCDDGVSRVVAGSELPIRRSRGQAPRPIARTCPLPIPILAVGGHLKNTFALGRHADAFVSHHVGDLDNLGAVEAFSREIALYERLFNISPEVIAHDLHPDYHSTRYAMARARSGGVPTLAVQHHHAHVASCAAEHGIARPIIGVAFDGSGYGEDGSIWGGEFLAGDARAVQRLAHLRTVPLAGGEQAVREPWRMAMAYLLDAGEDAELISNRHRDVAPLVGRMIERGVNAPMTSSAGRLFDAVAALAGVRDRVSFEGQAAMELEWLGADVDLDRAYSLDLDRSQEAILLDPRPLIREAAADVRRRTPRALIARRFHAGLAEGIAAVCRELRSRSSIDTVVLTGGVFLNGLLTRDCLSRLRRDGFQVYRHERVPPNDGGLSLGQLAVAGAQLARNR